MKHRMFRLWYLFLIITLFFPSALTGIVAQSPLPTPPPQPASPTQEEWDHFIFLPMAGIGYGPISRVYGAVTDGNDNPLSGVTITANGNHTAQTLSGGEYALSGLSNGLYELSAVKAGYTCTPVSIRVVLPPSESQNNFTCSTETYSYSGVIRDINGNPVSGALISDNQGHTAVTDSTGAFTFSNLPAGIYTFHPSGYDAIYRPAAITVRLGSTKTREANESIVITALATPWSPQSIGATAVLGGSAPRLTDRNLKVDAYGQVHVVFNTPAGLYYSTNNGEAWAPPVLIQGGAGVGEFASLALDSENRPHVVYVNSSNPANRLLMYTRLQSGGVWRTPLILEGDDNDRAGLTTSIAIDSDDHAHIVYFDDENDRLKYAFQIAQNGNFFYETIDDGCRNASCTSKRYPGFASLDLDANNNPYVSYYTATQVDYSDSTLSFAQRVGDNDWQRSNVRAGVLSRQRFEQLSLLQTPVDMHQVLSGIGLFNSLAIDSDGFAHIAYFNDDTDDLEYAFGSSADWDIDHVDKFEQVGGFASLDLDRNDNPHISYIRRNGNAVTTGGVLKYAYKTGPNWRTLFSESIGTVPAVIDVFDRTVTSIDLDSADNPHILFFNFDLADLMMVTRARWETQVVGLIGTLAEPSNRNLAVDSFGLPHIAFGGTGLYHGFYDGVTWNFELVDPVVTAGKYASIAVDSEENVYISYYDEGPQDLKYASLDRNAAIWTIETVDSSGDVGKFTTLVLDSNDRPHIAYFDETNDRLKYARKSGGWNIDIVDSHGAQGGYPSIALNSNNEPRIAYTDFDEDNQDLRYIEKNDGDWGNPAIIQTGDVKEFVSLGLDSLGRPHISYFQDNRGDVEHDTLKYAFRSGGAWRTQTVDDLNRVGPFNSLVIDKNDVIHISYYDLLLGNLKYASGGWRNWSVDTIDRMTPGADPFDGMFSSISLDIVGRPRFLYFDIAANVLKFARLNAWEFTSLPITGALIDPGRPSLDVDSAGRPHTAFGGDSLTYAYNPDILWSSTVPDAIAGVGGYASIGTHRAAPGNIAVFISYYDSVNGNLKLAFRPNEMLSPWTVRDVDNSSADVGKFSSLAMSGDTAHIAYFDETNDQLKYTRCNQTTCFAIEVVDTIGSVGSYPSIAVDGNGRVAISYYDIRSKDLLYAYKNDGVWTSLVIDDDAKVGLFSSLAFDSFNRPHIAYFSDDFDDLLYTRYDGQFWRYEVVDTNFSTGWYASLAIDREDRPHIAYYDFSNQDLKQAFKLDGDWVIEYIDTNGDVGKFTTLQLDVADQVHLVYYDVTNNVIKYVRAVDW